MDLQSGHYGHDPKTLCLDILLLKHNTIPQILNTIKEYCNYLLIIRGLVIK